jgi:fermentation-respiration switch protein FrsA (DUF1100 family)
MEDGIPQTSRASKSTGQVRDHPASKRYLRIATAIQSIVQSPANIYCPPFLARVSATRLLNGLRLLSLGAALGGGGACFAAAGGTSSKRFRPPLRARRGLGLRYALDPAVLGDLAALSGRGDADLSLLLARFSRPSAVSMRSALLLVSRLRSTDARLAFLPYPSPLLPALPSRSRRRRPRTSGLNELKRLLAVRSRRTSLSDPEALDERPRRFPLFALILFRGGDRDRDRERPASVEIVLTESVLSLLPRPLLLFLPLPLARSLSFFASMSSATPFLRTRSLGTSIVSAGARRGLSSCWVRDGRDL